jgi:hypothetical protein
MIVCSESSEADEELEAEEEGLGSEVSGLKFEVSSRRFEVSSVRFEVWGLRIEVWGLRFEVWGVRFERGRPKGDEDEEQLRLEGRPKGGGAPLDRADGGSGDIGRTGKMSKR